MLTRKNKELLIGYAEQYETEGFLQGDPSWFMHQVEGRENQEAMAFLASALSYGSRTQFMPKIQLLLDAAAGEPYEWVREGGYRSHFCLADGRCFYRLYSCSTMCRFLDAFRQLLTEYDTLGDYVRRHAGDGFGALEAVSAYFNEREGGAVVPRDTRSACKRLCMFLRWMVRSGSPVDLGLWSDFIDRRTLIMPLDTHVVSQSLRLGLLASGSATMSAARKLTAALARVFPDDPLRGDFALFGYGINHR